MRAAACCCTCASHNQAELSAREVPALRHLQRMAFSSDVCNSTVELRQLLVCCTHLPSCPVLPCAPRPALMPLEGREPTLLLLPPLLYPAAAAAAMLLLALEIRRA